MDKSQLCSCNIKGSVRIPNNNSKAAEFNIIELSAEGAKFFSPDKIDTSTQAKMQIILPAFLFQVKITTDYKIIEQKNIENGFEYTVEFVDLSERDRTGIDEIVRSTCGTYGK